MKLKIITLAGLCLISNSLLPQARQVDRNETLLQQRIDRVHGVIEFDELLKQFPGMKPSTLLHEVIRTKPTVIEFYQPSCSACDQMHSVFKELHAHAQQINLKVRIIKVNAAKYPGIAKLFIVTRTPMLAVYNKGRRIPGSVYHGTMELSELVRYIRVSLQ